MMLSFLLSVLTLAACWRIFQKMGHQGWEGIIPIYNTYILFQDLYGSGWKMLLLLIPFYNIYLGFKFSIDLAHAFHQSTGFGVGLVLLAPIFYCILGFGPSVYGDGSSAVTGEDVISNTLDQVAGSASGSKTNQNPTAGTADTADPLSAKLQELNELHKNGLLTDEEYKQMKNDLLKRF